MNFSALIFLGNHPDETFLKSQYKVLDCLTYHRDIFHNLFFLKLCEREHLTISEDTFFGGLFPKTSPIASLSLDSYDKQAQNATYYQTLL